MIFNLLKKDIVQVAVVTGHIWVLDGVAVEIVHLEIYSVFSRVLGCSFSGVDELIVEMGVQKERFDIGDRDVVHS